MVENSTGRWSLREQDGDRDQRGDSTGPSGLRVATPQRCRGRASCGRAALRGRTGDHTVQLCIGGWQQRRPTTSRLVRVGARLTAALALARASTHGAAHVRFAD